MARVAILSDSPYIPTGYSNQSKQLAKYLKSKGHDIFYFANGFTGATVEYSRLEDGTEFNYKVIGQSREQYFKDSMSDLLKIHKIDYFIILLDTFMLYGNDGWFTRIDTSPAKTIFWYPTDGGAGMPVMCDQILKKVDIPVAMSRFGQKQVMDYYGLKTRHIPHGTEKDRFRPLKPEERLQLRAKWNLQDKFVVGVVARNQPRKFLDRTIKTMALLRDKVPNAVLLLHMDMNDPAQPYALYNLIRRYNLENRVRFTGMTAFKGFDWNQMNEVYNLMDVFFLSTSGEGFGIPIIEAMSAGVPVVATDYTTTQELVKDNNSGFGVKLVGTENIDMFKERSQDYDFKAMNGTITGSWEVERGIMDVNNAVDKITQLAEDVQARKAMGEAGRKAVIEKYDFETIVGPMWEEILR